VYQEHPSEVNNEYSWLGDFSLAVIIQPNMFIIAIHT